MTSLFENARQVQHYASFRPTYPAALFERIVSAIQTDNTSSENEAADIGCGTGQATLPLVPYFAGGVTGVDPSRTQIAAANAQHAGLKNLSFVQGQAHQLPFGDQTLSCVTVAQAAHWFDLPAFYGQVQRVLRPGGVLAIWCYGLPQFIKDNDNNTTPSHATTLSQLILQDLYEDTLGPYWDERRRLVENLYEGVETIDAYYDNFETQRLGRSKDDGDNNNSNLDIHREWTPEQLMGYLRSWSAYAKYCQDHQVTEGSPQDPVRPIQEYFAAHDDDTTIPTVTPVRLFLSVKKRHDGQE